jgi:uncharacterized protein YkwD
MGMRLISVLVVAMISIQPSALSQAKDALTLSKEEQAVVELTNEERAKEKLIQLKPNRSLFHVARAHSRNMAKQKSLSHTLDGKDAAQRIRDSDYDYLEMAENIASGTKLSPKGVLALWMKSDLHKANILKPEVNEIGVGISTNDDGETYYTLILAKSRKK